MASRFFLVASRDGKVEGEMEFSDLQSMKEVRYSLTSSLGLKLEMVERTEEEEVAIVRKTKRSH
jgi:hypothetical protein